jgi:tetratricopeptide (TPR) repeat protein
MEKVSDSDRAYVYWLRTGWLQYLAGRHEESVASYYKASRLERSSIEAKLGMLLPQMTLGKWREAEKTVKEVLKKDRYNLVGSKRLAYILYNMGRYAEAEDRYRAVLNLYPADLEMQAGVGWSLLMQGKKDKAIEVFQEILVISPYHAVAKSGLSQAQAR